MYNLAGYTTTLASNRFVRVDPFSPFSYEKQVEMALNWAEEKINAANTSSCKGLARIQIGAAATALCEADSVENTPEHAERIRKLDSLLHDVCLKWDI